MNALIPLLTLLAAPQVAPDSTDEPLLRAVPEDALFVASIPRVAELRARAAENAWMKMVRDPELQHLRQWNRVHGGFDSWDELMKFDRALAEVEGLCVFIEPAGAHVATGLLLVASPERSELDRWLDQLFPGRGVVDRVAQDGLDIEVRELQDASSATHIAHVELSGLSAWLEGVGRDHALERARAVALRWKAAEATESILASERFGEARKDAGRRTAVELYADVGALVQLAIEEDQPDESEAKMLAAINVAGLSWARGSFDVGAGERFELELAAKLPDTGYLRTWTDLLGPAPKGLARWIPRDVKSVALSRIDVDGIYRSVAAMLEETVPEQREAMRAAMEMASQSTGADLEQDFLGQLTGDFASFDTGRPPAVDGKDPSSRFSIGLLTGMFLARSSSDTTPYPTVGYIIGLKDSSIVEQALSDLVAASGAEDVLAVEERQGVEVSSMTIQGDFGPRWVFLEDCALLTLSHAPFDAGLAMHADPAPPSVLDNT
ncbi:MAG TPA: hypothetical protein VMS76_08650, partial [Planctomycetota bacterium]|nr:hypothetical protein [Planctomycetota bacterium]